MRRTASTLLALAMVAGACRYQSSRVELQGASTEVSALAGDWSGEYSSVESGRSGSIIFRITAGSDTALGDVAMTPLQGQSVTAVDAASRAHAMHSQSPQLLRVTFVRIAGGMVQGELEPYVAPDCRCPVTTVFRGSIKGNTIEGEFVTRGGSGLQQTGRWSVSRKT
jgi:hypothetical protein